MTVVDETTGVEESSCGVGISVGFCVSVQSSRKV